MRGMTALLLLLGCNSDTDCATPSGTYKVTACQTSGNCPPGCDESVTMVGTGGIADATCTGTSVVSDDLCDVEIDQVCETYDSVTGAFTGHGRTTGTTSQVDGPDRIEGTVELTIDDELGNRLCSGVFDVTYERI